MSLRARLLLLLALLTALPALPAAWITRDLLDRSLGLALGPEVDAALQGGLELAQQEYRRRAQELRRDVGDLASRLSSIPAGAPEPRWREALRPWPEGDRIFVISAQDSILLAPGSAELSLPEAPRRQGEPPRRLHEEIAIGSQRGLRLSVERSLGADFHRRALRLQESLQLMRALRSERDNVRRGFWMPFLLIYAVGLLLAASVALWLGRGITGPVGELLFATERVAAGDWGSRVQRPRSDEIGRLGLAFNRMMQTLEAQSRRLVDLETMAGWREMARALAHEVKNPLTPIQLTVEEMRERYRGDDEDYRKLLEECSRIVVEEVQSLQNVVSRFREFSRPVELEWAMVDLAGLLRDVGALQPDLQVEVDVETVDEKAVQVRGDADRLRQVLMNLVSNARTATQGNTEARLWLSLRSVATDGRLRVEVEDNGPGIEPAERDRVFEPYRSAAQGGLGLGLALVKGIVLAHGGTITVEDGRTGGARFVIELPAHSGRVESEPEAPNPEDCP